MTKETYEKSVELQAAIEHTEDVLLLLHSIKDDERIHAGITEIGFVSRPGTKKLTDNELDAVIQAMADEKRRLELEFARL